MNGGRPMTDGEAVVYLETLDHLYGRLPPIESRAERVLAVARSAGDEQAVARVEAIIDRLGECPLLPRASDGDFAERDR